MSVPTIKLTVTLQDFTGTADAGGSLVIALCGFGQALPKITGTSMLAKVGPTSYKLATGVSTGINLWGNDVISPAGTYYSIALMDEKNNIVQAGIYQFTGNQTIDLSNATQLDIAPVPPLPPPLNYAGYTVVATGNAPAFDSTGAALQTFDFTLSEDVGASTAAGFAEGNLICFVIRQNGTGGWTFPWPGQCQNPPAINPVANGVTAAIFVVDAALNFYPLSGGTWN